MTTNFYTCVYTTLLASKFLDIVPSVGDRVIIKKLLYMVKHRCYDIDTHSWSIFIEAIKE